MNGQRLKQGQVITEPSAVALDARVYYGDKPRQCSFILKLSLASGATALGSVMMSAYFQNGL